MRLLIVEDEPKTAAYLQKGLSESGFIVDLALNGEDGLHLIRHSTYDLVVLDVMLPKIDGWTLMATIRKDYSHLRVLFLTARDDVADRVRGLEAGADDYLIKPFAFSELLARIRSLLRRSETKTAEVLQIDNLRIDLLRRKANRGDLRLNLSPKEFSLLMFLVQRTGEVLSRTLIAECVWDIHFDSDTNVVDVAIKRLRQKIDDPFDRKLIHTVRGMGYVLEER